MIMKHIKTITYRILLMLTFISAVLVAGCDDYLDVNGYIWESHIINRNFTIQDNLDNDYRKFISNISSDDSLPVECVIGYLLSNFENLLSA